ncbi:hypothetical protein [Streptosporangium roseum]
MFATWPREVREGEHRILKDARHSTINTDDPDAIAQGVRDLWQRVR